MKRIMKILSVHAAKATLISIVALAALTVLSSCSQGDSTISVIPQPQSVELHGAYCSLYGASLEIDPSVADNAVIKDFAAMFEGQQQEGKARICFERDSTLAPEAYTLDVRSKEISVRASSKAGFIYAVQTLRQLLPVQAMISGAKVSNDWRIRTMHVEDQPRFAYRGMHLDCSRHFFSTDEVKKYIDIMSLHKMNRLHWHLTDDQGWRVEIKKYPALSEVSAWRDGTMIGRDFGSNDGVRYGGFYTQEQLREIVAYADERGITIIPEVDLPGHMQAVLAAYPELGCTGGPYKVWQIWGVSENVLCAGKEETFTFIEDVLTELMDIFPSEYIHIGGDECPKTRWRECPCCQAKIKQLGLKADEKFSAEDYLQTYVMNRVEKFLNDHGRRIIGWDEILEGDISQSATIMSWRGSSGGIRAARSGRDAIMTPNSHFYFDYCQTRDIEHEPVCIGGYVAVDKVYSYEPRDPDFTDEQFSHILGVQANLWTEYIPDDAQLEYMLLPRMSALSEVQWCAPERKDWDRFREDMNHMREIYDALGYNYATHLFDGRLDAERAALGTYSHKAQGKNVQLLTVPYSSYRFNAPAELFDGKRGDMDFHSGAWIGFHGKPLEVVIEMDKTKFSSVMIEILSDKGNYIFAPTWLKASVSEDGVDFQELASSEYEPQTGKDKDGVMQFELSFPKTKAKYLKVEAGTIDVLPEWHPGAGARAFLFVDEVVVR